jgi:hypothetical protein
VSSAPVTVPVWHRRIFLLFFFGLVKVNSCPCASLIRHNAMKAYGGSGCIVLPFLTSALDGGEWSTSLPGRVTPGEIAPPLPGTHWIGGWVGPRTGLDVMEEKKNLALVGHRTPAVQPVACTDWDISVLLRPVPCSYSLISYPITIDHPFPLHWTSYCSS